MLLFHIHRDTNTHTHTHTYIYIYIYTKHIYKFLPRLLESLFLRQVNVRTSPCRICAKCIERPVQWLTARDDRHLYSGFSCIYYFPRTLQENNVMGPYNMPRSLPFTAFLTHCSETSCQWIVAFVPMQTK